MSQDTTLPPLPEPAFKRVCLKYAGGDTPGLHREGWVIVDLDAFSADQMMAAIAAQAQQPIKLRGTPRKSDYLGGARFYALMYGLRDDAPGYLPRTREQADQFEPHAWVLSAMMQAFGDGWADGHSAGLDLMKQAQQDAAVKESLTLEQVEAVADVDDAAYALLAILQRVGPGATVGQVLAILEQAQQAQGVPKGWRLVPEEPTPEMLQAGEREYQNKERDMFSPTPTEFYDECGGPMGYAWLAMLAAAPQAEPQPEREPLTVDDLWSSDEVMSLNADYGWNIETIWLFACVIERLLVKRWGIKLAGIGTKGGDKP